MKTTKTYFNFFMMIMIFTALNVSCDGEDGSDGLNGINGMDGAQGPAGVNGTNGTDGTDGEDGNANVQVLTYDLSMASSSFHEQAVPEITQEVLANDVILGYVSAPGPNSANTTYPLPAIADNLPINIAVAISEGFYSLDFVASNGGPASIIEGELDTKEAILSELKNAGVDISDYYAVMGYFHLKY